MKTLTRQEAIEALVDDDINTTSAVDGQEYLYNILKSGFKGYDNFTNRELKEEYSERLNPEYEKIKVVK